MSLIVGRSAENIAKAPKKRKVYLKAFVIIFLIFFFILLHVVYFIWQNYKIKDSVRMADMAFIQAVMQEIYFEQGNYDISLYCNKGEALLTEKCWSKFQNYISDMQFLNDPNPKVVCSEQTCNKACAYSLIENTSENYKILFHLDRKYGNLKAGCHYLDKFGIH